MSGSAAIARDRLHAVRAIDAAVRGQSVVADAAIAKRDQQLRVVAGAHEATRPSRSRKMSLDWGSANRIVGMDAWRLRTEARRLERDHDISRNALNILVQNTVGSGIDVLPMPRLPGGKVDRGLSRDLKALHDEWWDRPEVTWRHDYGKSQQLLARSAFRDGEALYQMLAGPVDYLDHGTAVPFSLELIEADYLPLDLEDAARNISQGIERNAWGRVLAYHLYKDHPGDGRGLLRGDTKRVSADQMQHIALVDRIHQLRGLSIFASVICRLADIKDYEDSERIAAKVAASLTAYIKKGDPAMYGQSDNGTILAGDADPRAMAMRPGLIADDLLPGEEIGLIDSKRPNPNTDTFRSGQLRAAAGGFGVSYSSLSMNYDGTYSAQRQELVEKWGAYQMLGEWFVAVVMRPVWRRFVSAAVLSGQIKRPRGYTDAMLAAATFVRPVMPWIDPLKEGLAKELAEDRRWVSPQQNTLLAGNDPDDVLEQAADWQERLREAGLNAATNAPPPGDASAAVRSALRLDAAKDSE